jgi:hypothetical protein
MPTEEFRTSWTDGWDELTPEERKRMRRAEQLRCLLDREEELVRRLAELAEQRLSAAKMILGQTLPKPALLASLEKPR